MRSHLPIEVAFESLDFVPLGVFVLNSDLTVQFWNACLEEWTHLSRQEMIGQRIDRHFPHLNQPKYLSRLHQIFDGGHPILFSSQLHPHLIPIVRPDGQLQVQQTIVTAKPGAIEGEFFALWSIQDVSDLSNQVSRYKAEQIKAQQNAAALRESEERWQLALQGNNDGIWDWNIQTNEVFFSARWQEMLGLTDVEITNHVEEWSNRIHPDDLAGVMAAVQAHLIGTAPFYSSEYRLQCQDGSYKWVLGRGQALRDAAGTAVRMVGSHTDITDRKQVEQALQESEARFRIMADSAPVLIWLSGIDGLCTFFNQTWLNFTGRSLEQEFGDGWAEGVHPDDLQGCLDTYSTAFAKRESFQMDYRLRRADGEYRWILDCGTPRFTASGKFVGFIGSCQDIHDRKVSEEALRQSELTLRSFFNTEAMLMGIVELHDHDILHLSDNQTTATFFGTTSEAMHNRFASEMGIPQSYLHRWMEAYREAAQTQAPVRFEYPHDTPSGQRWLAASVCQIANSSTQYPRFSYIVEDITERKRTELALEQELMRTQILFNTSIDGIVVMNHQGNVVQTSSSFAQMLGYTVAETLKLNVADWDAQWTREELQQIRESHLLPPIFETRHRRQDGSLYDVEISYSKAALDGELMHFCICRDITARKQAEVTKQALIESIPDFLVRMRRDGLQLEVLNRGAIHMIQPEAEICGTLITNTMPPAIAQARIDLAQRALATNTIQTQEYQFDLDGTVFYEEARIAPLGRDEVLVVVRDITERYRAEQALRDSEEKFRQLAENIHQVFFVLSAEGQMLYISPAYEQVWQRSCDHLYADPQSWLEAVYVEDRPRIAAALHHQILRKQPFNETYRIVRNGEIRWIAAQSLPLKDNAGNVIRFTGIAEDITQQKQAEVALRHSEATKQAIIQAIPDLLIRMQADGHYVDFISNSKFNIINPDQIRDNANIYDVLPPALAQLRLHYTQQALRSQTTQIYEQQILIDGKQCYEEVRIVPFLQDEVLVMVRDITEHKQAEMALKLSQERLQLALEASGDGLWDWDLATDQVYLNPYYQEMLGYRPNELVMDGNVWETMIHPEDRPWVVEQLQHHLHDSSAKYSFDYRMRCKSGEWKWIADYGKVVARDQQGKPLRMIGTHKDISDRKQKELALRQAMEAAEAANVAKSMFLANMSHELRTPLNVILGFAQVMAHDSSLTSEQLQDLQTIRRSGDHLLSLINDVLDLSKIEAGHCSLEEVGFDLLALLHGLRTMMTERATSKRLQLIFELASELPQFVIADEQKLRQILLNLLSNAIKFTKQGSVTLRVSSVDPNFKTPHPNSPSAVSLCFPSPTLLQFEVIDTGVGIAPEEQSLIFDAFVQAEAGKQTISGTGLGLTISRRLLELMHGSMAVQSTPNLGSTFTCTVPVRPTSSVTVLPDHSDRTVIGLAPGQAHRRILVVDDQRENRLLMVRLLTQLGLEVREATNGQEAIYIWQAWQPDLIWMDIRMPGLDGYEATRQIRAMEQETFSIIIALTAQASHSDRSLALAAGCNDYVSKPFQEATLFAKLKEYLGLEYLYAELNSGQEPLQQPACPAEPDLATLLKPSLLANLSPGWLEALEDAAVCGNDRVIIELTTQLPSELAALREYLVKLADEFQFELILSWVECATRGETDHAVT